MRCAAGDSSDSVASASGRYSSGELTPARLNKCHARLRSIVGAWRGLALHWQCMHVPGGSYERMVRASSSEIPAADREIIRRDILRSRPSFATAPWSSEALDVTAHVERLERVLCAWTQYDPEIGYVQAMNIVASTLLLLLDGDEEATFWTLVTLLRQLPPQFYQRKPSLLGFWTEVEVLAQLAGRLLHLGDRERIGVRHALLQVAPRWMLEFWVGTLPLETIVLIWDHMLRAQASNASNPSVLGLQVSLVLLSQVKPQIEAIYSEYTASTEVAQHRAFNVLSNVRVPDASASWLLHRAQQVRLNVAAVQDMRLQLRIALVERMARGGPHATLPCAEPLPEATDGEAGTKPLPILRPPPPPRVLRYLVSLRGLAHLLAVGLATTALAISIFVWSQTLTKKSTDWEVYHVDTLITIGIVWGGVLVGWRFTGSRPAVALGSCVAASFLASKAIEVLLDCAARGNDDAKVGNGTATAPPPPPPPRDCHSWEALWPVLLCALILTVAVLQVGLACAVCTPRLALFGSGGAGGGMSRDSAVYAPFQEEAQPAPTPSRSGRARRSSDGASIN